MPEQGLDSQGTLVCVLYVAVVVVIWYLLAQLLAALSSFLVPCVVFLVVAHASSGV